MRRSHTSNALAMLAAVAFALPGGALAQVPRPTPIAQTPPPEGTPTPAPTGNLLRVSGQLLDVQKGFAFFTTGDGFKLAPNAAIVDLASGAPVALGAIPVRIYAVASFDPATGLIQQLKLSKTRQPSEQSFENVRRFAVVQSTPGPNPELDAKRGLTGKPVAVTFVVQVPPTTGFSDQIYISTDQSSWDPRAIRMDRIDSLHYRITQKLPSGTEFRYRYTRGSWLSAERGRTGLDTDPHTFKVSETDALRRSDVVYYWSDDNPSAAGNSTQNNAGGPTGIPTPFNPVPFGFPQPPRPAGAPPVQGVPAPRRS